MNRGRITPRLLLLLLLPHVLHANDDAVIYPVSSGSKIATVRMIAPTPSAPAASTEVRAVLPVAEAKPNPGPVTKAPTVSLAPTPVALPPVSGKTYTVRPGDNLYRIGKANKTTLEAIKALNHLDSDTIRVGQVLQLPLPGFSYRPPQPVPKVQMVTLSAPVPAVTATSTSATPTASVRLPMPEPISSRESVAKTPASAIAANRPAASAPSTTLVSPNSVVRIPYQLTYNEAQAKLMAEAENLAKLDLAYNEAWRPPGEEKRWAMDCSNTSRYLYKKALGIQLPRTASDQYYDLKVQGMAWDVPTDSKNNPDVAYLKRNLRVGDLLFWENTYKPERDPPITHVTVFMGTDAKGNWIMAGSQSASYGKYGDARGGPDIYTFDPVKTAGGYSAWFGFVRHKGRFVAIGRPLGLYPAAVVANNTVASERRTQ